MQNIHLGTIGFSYNFWKGELYPNKTAQKNYLSYYSSQFNTVEIDSSFYRIPTPQTVENWRKQVPEGFLFSLKFPQIITQIKMLKDCQYETEVFLERADLLGENLGLCFCSFHLTSA